MNLEPWFHHLTSLWHWANDLYFFVSLSPYFIFVVGLNPEPSDTLPLSTLSSLNFEIGSKLLMTGLELQSFFFGGCAGDQTPSWVNNELYP